MPNKSERFTQRARRVLSLAQQEAESLQHSYIGTEHLLLGPMREEGGVASRVLAGIGLDIRRVIDLTEKMTKADRRVPNTRLDLSTDVKKSLEFAVYEARRMGHHYIGTEHLLLGLLRQKEEVAIDILKRLNVSPEEVRRQTRRVLEESPVTRTQPGEPNSPQGLRVESAQVELGMAQRSSQKPASQQVTYHTHFNWLTILGLAQAHAEQLQHQKAGPEHLLLALVRSDRDRPWHILKRLTVTDEQLMPLMKELLIEKLESSATPEPSLELIRVLGWAMIEAFRSNTPFLRTDHLLLGLVASGENGATKLLKQLNVDPAPLRS